MSSVYARRSGTKRGYPVKASTTIQASEPVFLLAGFAVPLAGADDSAKFCGVSTFVVESSGVDGEMTVEVEHQQFALKNGGDIAPADVGEMAYFSDIYTVTKDSTAHPAAGTIAQLEGDWVWIIPAVA
ncbi:hypothetical protein [Vibrio quintilis]|uniref:DUF2190 family protein n=1 Tax=Vibrio quintilis TaxID=1117707 RepID=A0A1M7Z1P4_9VIBR|nr:hypothetical protein [Vibrio quintilis]SHO58793.1 hypothetical protein VQ7734_04565 [Vibrio quintilis]